MFNDFDYKDWLKGIDSLIRDGHYGSYNELHNLTMKELGEIFTVIQDKQQEEQLAQSLNQK